MKPLSAIALVIGLVFLQGRSFGALPQAKLENRNVAAARQAIEVKDFKSAIGNLMKAVQQNPNDADAHTMLGYSYRKLGAFAKSMEHYQIALKIDPNHPGAHEYLGELYLEMNQPANAETQLQALKKNCPFFGKCVEYDELKEAINKYKTNNSRSAAEL
jgi:tetratricopeptide (TPR) repeat protein